MTKKVILFIFIVFIIYLCESCGTTKCVVYNLKNYVDTSTIPPSPYIPIYNPNDSEWIRAELILKTIVAPANWGSYRHQFSGLDYRLYIKTTKKNQKKISAALPTFWNPN